jgi:hypothetical protein
MYMGNELYYETKRIKDFFLKKKRKEKKKREFKFL